MDSYALHEELNLYITGNKSYTFAPTSPARGQMLTLHRASGDIILNPPNTPLPPNVELSRDRIYGIIGLVSLSISDYLIVLTGRELRGQFMGKNIYRATDFKILPLSPDISAGQSPVESHLLALVQSHFQSGMFWFSYGWDLTRRLQSQWASRSKGEGKPMWEAADDRFFWNKFLFSRFIDIATVNPQQNLSPYILPIMFGTFDIRPALLNGKSLLFCLISRRSRFRAGTRYFRRGVDHDGHVANFNETEQIVLVGQNGEKSNDYSTTLSFVQIRGSIPLYWAEINTLRYKPDLQVMELQDSGNAMRLHLQEQVKLYGEQSLINLVKQKGHEKPVKDAYEKHIDELRLPKVKYEYFDFSDECKHMQWDRINGLIGRLEEDLIRQGYFHADSSHSEPLKLQLGTVRTNCMDNLDRTNVSQAALAKWTLNRQLRQVGILSEGETVDTFEQFMNDFRNMWADHADLISKAYSGTGALKTDYTRTGKRTMMGALDDGYNSIIRYFKNNYFDGARQDAFDIVTGAWVPRRGVATINSLVLDRRPLMIRSMPYVAFFALFMICAGLTLPRTSDYSLLHYFLLWFAVLSLSIAFIFVHGIDYVAWPRLNPPTDAIYYEGPGFRSGHHGKGLGVSSWDSSKLKSGVKTGTEWTLQGRRRAASHVNEIEMGTKKRVD